MHLPRLPSISNADVYVKGDVSINQNAAIAPGVILQADPDSRIIIAAGVCIGMGAILHAHKGTLEVEAGAVLGAGVLVVGVSKIGEHACIGATTTIWNSSVESWQVVPPGSVVGDKGQKMTPEAAPEPAQASPIAETPPALEETAPVTEATPAALEEPAPVTEATPAALEEPVPMAEEAIAINSKSATPEAQPQSAPTAQPSAPEAEAPEQLQFDANLPPVGVTVYGQIHLNRLLLTLFPHKSVNPPPEEGQSK
jgi:carbon dioxide concentrating mechanism protein CcmN